MASYRLPLPSWPKRLTVGPFSIHFFLARISHHLTAEARNRRASTSLRLLAVLNGLLEYACAHYCPVNDSLTGGNRLF